MWVQWRSTIWGCRYRRGNRHLWMSGRFKNIVKHRILRLSKWASYAKKRWTGLDNLFVVWCVFLCKELSFDGCDDCTCVKIFSGVNFWATVCNKTVRPLLSDCCPVCDVGALWPNGWTNQGETWRASMPQPWPHCVRWGSISPSPKGHSPPPNFWSISVAAKWLHGLSKSHISLLLEASITWFRYAGCPICIAHAGVTLTQSKIKVTGRWPSSRMLLIVFQLMIVITVLLCLSPWLLMVVTLLSRRCVCNTSYFYYKDILLCYSSHCPCCITFELWLIVLDILFTYLCYIPSVFLSIFLSLHVLQIKDVHYYYYYVLLMAFFPGQPGKLAPER